MERTSNLHFSSCTECIYQTKDGALDMRTLGNIKKPKFADIPDQDKTKLLTYSYNGCFSYNEGSCKKAAACKKDLVSKTSSVIAIQKDPKFDYSQGISTLEYTNGNDIQVQVFLVCEEKDEQAKGGMIDAKSYGIYILNKCACPGKCKYVAPRGLSGGAVIVIIFLCLLVVYLIGGILYMRYMRGARGVEMLLRLVVYYMVPFLHIKYI
ncbi:unnamed protein product [Didymodactylos carnosus]|uniref:Uncharacterized protein n=1 Tax=Didymodactylos carnosus TaxID=1234261 RepID=A0A815J571_9BILA|nr:unnamed protein product [Didymodactylos carnosus]CAF4264069.1 unnamed protein product [Didymodactylos carnosus]